VQEEKGRVLKKPTGLFRCAESRQMMSETKETKSATIFLVAVSAYLSKSNRIPKSYLRLWSWG